MLQKTSDFKVHAEDIFLAGIEGALPSKLIKKYLMVTEKGINVNNTLIPWNSFKNIYVIGAGKASGAMAETVENILGERVSGGHVIVKYGHTRPLKRIKITEAGHPVPDHNGFVSTKEIVKIASEATTNDLVFCLISGGGSALLADYPEGISEKDMIKLNKLLVNCGASISEINIVRKHVSLLKGGQLARLVYPATLVSLIISDVPGDSPAVIASGPACPDNSTFADAIAVIEKYRLAKKLPAKLIHHLEKGLKGKIPENPGPEDKVFERSYNIIIGNNRAALEAASLKAKEKGYNCIIESDLLCCDVVTAAKYIFDKALLYSKSSRSERPHCVLFGGETTIEVKGKGVGGRNQHLALLCAKILRQHRDVTILCGGTDGTDGPTDAAGAIVDCNTWTSAIMNRIDPNSYLENYDSFNFFREAGGHVITGPTFTNVMDMVVLIC
ncbi:MAG: glycerate kinase type-2 family protein [Bacteroidales bacterium]